MVSRQLLILGAGGHGRVVADVGRSAGYLVTGYADKDSAKNGLTVDSLGAHVVTSDARIEDWLSANPHTLLALGIGDNSARLRQLARFRADQFPVLVHGAATVAASVELGLGTVVMPRAVVNSGSRVGKAVIVNSAAVVEHDVEIGDGAHVSPGAILTGGCLVEESAWVGANATVLPGVRIGAGAIVGAGAVVLSDVLPGSVVVGNPARRLR